MQGVPIWQKTISGEGRGFFFLPDFFGVILQCFCGAAVPLCRPVLSLFSHVQHIKIIIKYPTWGMYVRAATVRDAKRMWRPSCFLPKHDDGTLGIIKSPVQFATTIILKITIPGTGIQ